MAIRRLVQTILFRFVFAAVSAMVAGAGCASLRGDSRSSESVSRAEPATADSAATSDLQPLSDDPLRITTSNAGTYRVGYTTQPDPIPLNELFDIEVRIRDAGGMAQNVAQNIDLIADADMPAHRHGMLRRPVVERLGDGEFIVRGMQFHMPGEWVLYFDITRDGITERAQFDVELD